jgi:hypothetical protein
MMDPVAHLISLFYTQERTRLVAELLQGPKPKCPRCGVDENVAAAAEPWSDESLIWPRCHETRCDASAVEL